MRIPFVILGLLVATAAAGADVKPLSVLGEFHAPDGDWDHIAFNSDTGRLYVARANGLLAIELDSEKVTPTFVPGSKVHVAVPLPGGDILITNGGSNSAILADGRDGRIKATVPTGKMPDTAILDPATGLVTVANAGSADVTLIDPKAHSAVGRIEIDGVPDGVAVDGEGKLFVNLSDKAQIAVIDIRARKVINRIDLKNCDRPTGLAYAKTHRILLAACTNSTAKAMSVDDGRSLAELPIGPGADDVLFDDTRGLGFIASGGDGTLAVVRIDGPRDITIVQTVKTADGARTVAFDPQTQKLYLPAAKLLTPARGPQTQTPESGTFGIVIVGAPPRS